MNKNIEQNKSKSRKNINISNDPLMFLDINVNYDSSHIEVKNPKLCEKNCKEKPCTQICPSHVYEWTGKELEYFYQRCVECGACILVCPHNNILLEYPAGGYGVIWKY